MNIWKKLSRLISADKLDISSEIYAQCTTLLRNQKLFRRGWYLEANIDLGHISDPLYHYLVHGAKEGRNPNPLFDGDWYFKQRPDVAEAGINPLLHYLAYGEGADPHPLFDTKWYLKQRPDVARANRNPLVHYLVM